MYYGVFFLKVICDLIRASALLSPQPVLSAVRISMRAFAPGSSFSELLLSAVRPSHGAASERAAPNLEVRASSGAEASLLLRRHVSFWVHMFLIPTFMHVIRLAVPASVKALCWLPVLTSGTWRAPWRWALRTLQGIEIKLVKRCYLMRNVARFVIQNMQQLSVLNRLFLRTGSDVWLICGRDPYVFQ